MLNTYNLVESVRLSQLAVKEATESKSKERQRDFFWNLVKRHVAPDTIEALYTSSEHQPIPEEWKTKLSMDTRTEQTNSAEPTCFPHRPMIPQRVPQYFQPQGRSWSSYNGRGGSGYQPVRELPNASKSNNEFINGKRKYMVNQDGFLCVKCGETGHMVKTCTGRALPAWEQSYLRTIVFGDATPQVNFAKASYGEYDSYQAVPYGTKTTSSESLPVATVLSSSLSCNAQSI